MELLSAAQHGTHQEHVATDTWNGASETVGLKFSSYLILIDLN